MKDQIRKFLNEEQDPKAIEKITSKLSDLLMKNEEVGYIGVQKKPVTVFPDSVVLTNKRIIICKPKNLGFSMDFVDYNWDSISHTFVNESIVPGYHMSKVHWNTISINGDVSDKLLCELISDSYDLIFKGLTKKIQREIVELEN